MMNKTTYLAPAVIIVRIESPRLLSSSPLSVGYSNETTSEDANSRNFDFDDEDDGWDDHLPRRKDYTDCDW